MTSILLTGPGIAQLLVSDGPGHRAAFVAQCLSEGCRRFREWRDTFGDQPGWTCRNCCGEMQTALPLLWHGLPVWSAVDAVVRAGEAADPREPLRGWSVWEEHRQSTGYPGLLALAREAASVLGVEVVEVEHG